MRLTLFVLTFFVMSCGPAWHLKRAELKGAKVKTDTVYQQLITESTVTDTITRFQTVRQILAGDTVIVNTVKWRLKERFDTLTKTVYRQVECKPDTIRVATAMNTTIEAGYSIWVIVKWVILALFVGALLTIILYKR